jgi:hypothetical protein
VPAPGDQAALMQSFAGNALVHGVLAAGPIEAMAYRARCGCRPATCWWLNWTTALWRRGWRGLWPIGLLLLRQEDERIFYANDSYRFLAESVFLQDPRPRHSQLSEIAGSFPPRAGADDAVVGGSTGPTARRALTGPNGWLHARAGLYGRLEDPPPT